MVLHYSLPRIVHRQYPGWLGLAKVSCILRHRDVQLILAYSWTRPAILVAGNGRGGVFLFLLFLHFHSFSSSSPVPPFHLLYFCLSSPFLLEWTQNDPQRLTCRLTPTNQSIIVNIKNSFDDLLSIMILFLPFHRAMNVNKTEENDTLRAPSITPSRHMTLIQRRLNVDGTS